MWYLYYSPLCFNRKSSYVATFGGSLLSGRSLLSGFTNNREVLSLLSGGRYFRNFTVVYYHPKEPVLNYSGRKARSLKMHIFFCRRRRFELSDWLALLIITLFARGDHVWAKYSGQMTWRSSGRTKCRRLKCALLAYLGSMDCLLFTLMPLTNAY